MRRLAWLARLAPACCQQRAVCRAPALAVAAVATTPCVANAARCGRGSGGSRGDGSVRRASGGGAPRKRSSPRSRSSSIEVVETRISVPLQPARTRNTRIVEDGAADTGELIVGADPGVEERVDEDEGNGSAANREEILRIQAQNPDHILLTQVGGFFEIYSYQPYFEEIASMLDLTIGRNGMAGFPLASLDKYLERLIERGKTVGIVTQVARDSMSLSKNYSRAVTRIVTPGTSLTETIESLRQNQYLLAVFSDPDHKDRVGLAWADVNTGNFVLSDCTPDAFESILTR
ncbi:DNA mismatch repair ATPase msh1, partial [Cladochytrium tenue]